jgi:hypothetical protein
MPTTEKFLSQIAAAATILGSDTVIGVQSGKKDAQYKITDLAAYMWTKVPVISTDMAAGDYNVTNESTLLINKTVPAAHNINLPTAASRNGIPIVIKDFAGNASTYVATIVPNGAETIDGLSTLPINSDYGGFNLVPITGGWYISP